MSEAAIRFKARWRRFGQPRHDQTVIFSFSARLHRKVILPFVNLVADSKIRRRWFRLRGAETLPLAFRRFTSASIRWLTIVRLASIFLAQAAMIVCGANAQAALPRENTPEIENTALRLLEDVQESDWTAAMEQLQQISKVAKPVLMQFDEAGAKLTRALVRSTLAVRNRDRTGALHGANKILEWTDSQEALAQPNVPPEVPRLRYLAREIQIEVDASDEKRLADRIVEVRRCWERLTPVLEKDGDAVVAQEGEKIIRELEQGEKAEAPMQAHVSFSQFVGQLGDVFDHTRAGK